MLFSIDVPVPERHENVVAVFCLLRRGVVQRMMLDIALSDDFDPNELDDFVITWYSDEDKDGSDDDVAFNRLRDNPDGRFREVPHTHIDWTDILSDVTTLLN